MTEPEVMLWSRLRGRGGDCPTFRRQHPFGSIILDFYCPSVRLAIEVDGRTHWDEQSRSRDEARDRWLESQGVTVLRIPAGSVFQDLGGVVDAIHRQVAELQRLAPSTTPSAGRGPPPAASRGR